jgi:hypothetical protein
MSLWQPPAEALRGGHYAVKLTELSRTDISPVDPSRLSGVCNEAA